MNPTGDPNRDYGPQPILRHQGQRIRLDWVWEHWVRIAQLFASLAYGHMTAWVALKRLEPFGLANHVYRAT